MEQSAPASRIDGAAAYDLLNPMATAPLLLVCDHASARLPEFVGDLGVDAAVRHSHLAIDRGAAALTRRMAASLGACAVLAGYSRLVVDCNRDIHDAAAFVAFSDGVAIPGNRGLGEAQKQVRIELAYRPYHAAIDTQVRRLGALGTPPALLAIHSFTPVFEGHSRPWEVGVLADGDGRIALPLIAGLRRAQLVVGDNQPYSGMAARLNYTLVRHASAAGLPHVCIEVRQDLLSDATGVQRMAAILCGIIAGVPGLVRSEIRRRPASARTGSE